LIGFDPADGALLWEVPYKVSFDAASVTPVVHDGLVIFSSEQKPVEAHRIVERGDGLAAELAWTTGDAHFQFSSPVLAAGRLIGFSTRNKGQVVAIDPADGKLLWAGPPRQGENAFLIAAGPVVLVVRSGRELDVVAPGAARACAPGQGPRRAAPLGAGAGGGQIVRRRAIRLGARSGVGSRDGHRSRPPAPPGRPPTSPCATMTYLADGPILAELFGPRLRLRDLRFTGSAVPHAQAFCLVNPRPWRASG
jgi:hypothetical protein